MKTLILLLTVGTIGITGLFSDSHTNKRIDTKVQSNEIQMNLTFDGYEGDSFFFSDASGKAVNLEVEDLQDYDINLFLDNEVVGEQFTICTTEFASVE